MNHKKRLDIFNILAKSHPDPTTELEYHSCFQLLIAVMLSAQATDRSVNLATPSLFREAPTPKAMLDLGEESVRGHIKTIGLFRSKAKNIINTCKLLLANYDGQVPSSREALQSLPGVGRKTANVVLNVGFGQPTIAVDTHIFRVSNRTGLAKGRTPDAVELSLEKWTPTQHKMNIHHRLILHGRYVCVARKPLCTECELYNLCEYKDKTK